MKLEKCRVQNYRCILDSGWVDLDDIAVLVGKNESGKTSFLKALWRLNPYEDVAYNIDREWPIGKRAEKDPEKTFVEAVFSFSAEEQLVMANIYEPAKDIRKVEVKLNYRGECIYQFLPQNPNMEYADGWVAEIIKSNLRCPEGASDHFADQYNAAVATLVAELTDSGSVPRAIEGLGDIKDQLVGYCALPDQDEDEDEDEGQDEDEDEGQDEDEDEDEGQDEDEDEDEGQDEDEDEDEGQDEDEDEDEGQDEDEDEGQDEDEDPDQDIALALDALISSVISSIEDDPISKIMGFAEEQMPTFIYMDDYRTFVGSAQLDEIQKHKNEGRLQLGEETIIMIMNMAGLDLDSEVERGSAVDSEQRMHDMSDAGKKLTKLLANRWRQQKYEVSFRADGHHFITFLQRQGDEGLVRLEEKSKGFQWFFSFDMLFTHETKGKFNNAILLLDEPGLHLHASAQQDLLDRMKDYAKDNQLIYTTHMPFMVDCKRLDNIYIAEETATEGTKIHANWEAASGDDRFTLQAALGLSWSQSLFIGQYNLVVEGVDDFWFLMTFSTLFENAGQKGLNSDLVVTPAGGASKVAYIGTILHGQKLNVAVLLDSDLAGENALKQIVHKWILEEDLVVMVGAAVGLESCAIEDLFNEAYYIEKVNEIYSRELPGKPIALDPKTAGKKLLVGRVEDAFKKKRRPGRFNKGRVAKVIMRDLGEKSLSDLDGNTVASFRKVIDAINKVVSKWKK